jgi:zinc-ribbon domain
MRNWRKMTWVLIGFTVLMAIWAIAGTGQTDCGDLTDEAEKLGCDAGEGIAVGIIFLLWFLGFVVLSLVWFMTRPKDRRECPACGTHVKRGETTCPSCGHDFRAAARAPAPGT